MRIRVPISVPYQLCPYLTPLLRYSEMLSKIANLKLPPPLFGAAIWDHAEFHRHFWQQKTSLPALSYGVVCMILRFAALVQYRQARRLGGRVGVNPFPKKATIKFWGPTFGRLHDNTRPFSTSTEVKVFKVKNRLTKNRAAAGQDSRVT